MLHTVCMIAENSPKFSEKKLASSTSSSDASSSVASSSVAPISGSEVEDVDDNVDETVSKSPDIEVG